MTDISVEHNFSSGDVEIISSDVITRQIAEHCYELKMMGMPYTAIASSMDLSEKEVRKAVNRLRKAYASKLEKTPGKNLVADACMFLERMEQMFLYDANLCDSDNEYIDGTTGQVKTHKNNSGKDKLKYLQAAVDVRQKRLSLLMDTGIIAKEPQKLQHTLMGGEEKKDDTEINKSEAEIKADMLKLLERGRML